MKLVYPAVFYPEEEGGYSVIIPDLLGCCTQGETIEEALVMAQDAALGWLLAASEEKEDFPQATDRKDIKIEREDGFVSLLLLDVESYFKKYGNREEVEKTLVIPNWLNEKAEKHQINFSETLQEALLYKIMHNSN